MERGIKRYIVSWQGEGSWDFGTLGGTHKTLTDAHRYIVEDFISNDERYTEDNQADLIKEVLDKIGSETYSVEPKDYGIDYNCRYNIESAMVYIDDTEI
jgi:hypothetical protein